MVAISNTAILLVVDVASISFHLTVKAAIILGCIAAIVSCLIFWAIARNTREFTKNIYVKDSNRKRLNIFEKLQKLKKPIHYRKAQIALTPLLILSLVPVVVFIIVSASSNTWYSDYQEILLSSESEEIFLIRFFIFNISFLFGVSFFITFFFFWIAFMIDFKKCACPECGNIVSHEIISSTTKSNSYDETMEKEYAVKTGSVQIDGKSVGNIYSNRTVQYKRKRFVEYIYYEIRCCYCGHTENFSELVDSWSINWE